MDFYLINQSPTVDHDYVILDDEPVGTNMTKYRMTKGMVMGDKYPKDAKWYMSKDWPGHKLGSLIATVTNLLVVHRTLKEIFESTGVPMECFPFDLYDRKKRLASRDYFIINPLGTLDCLDLQQSIITYSSTGAIISVDKHVLDPRKLTNAPDIFRIQEDPRSIVLSHRLINQLRSVNPTNLYFFKLEQSGQPAVSG